MAEAIKLAAADREAFYGDPRFVRVPLDRLLSTNYAAQRRRLIDPRQASPGLPPQGRCGWAAIHRSRHQLRRGGGPAWQCILCHAK